MPDRDGGADSEAEAERQESGTGFMGQNRNAPEALSLVPLKSKGSMTPFAWHKPNGNAHQGNDG